MIIKFVYEFGRNYIDTLFTRIYVSRNACELFIVDW
jgi:hypothetical protein